MEEWKVLRNGKTWTDMKQNINSISQEEKNLIELTALLTSIRKDKNITQKDLALEYIETDCKDLEGGFSVEQMTDKEIGDYDNFI